MIAKRWMTVKRGARKHALSGNRPFGAGSFLWLLMIITLVLSTGACSKQSPTEPPSRSTPGSATNENGKQPGGQPTAVSQEVPAKPGVISSGGGEVITFATYSFLEEVYKPILEEFQQQYPTIKVQIREVPPTLDPRLIASAADTSMIMAPLPNAGSYFLDLTPFEEGDPSFEASSFWPGILDACKDGEGRAYGLPIFAEPTGIYYQEKAFVDAGLPLPGPGWTWEDFQKAVNSLTRTEGGKPVYGFADDSFVDAPDETLLSPRISYLLDQTGGKIDTAGFEKDLGWYLNLVRSGGLYSANTYPQRSPVLDSKNTEAWSQAWNETWSTYHEIFLNHPPAMWKGRLNQVYWGDADIKALPDGSLNMTAASGPIMQSKEGIGWAPFPVSADAKNNHTSPSMVTYAAISAGTQHPRAAWTWLSFLAAHPAIPEWSLAVPAQPATAEANGFWGKVPEKARESMRFAAEHGWYSNPYPEAVLSVNQALIKAVAENTDLRAALEEANRQVETAIQPTPDIQSISVAPPEPTAKPGATRINYFSLFFNADDPIQKLAEAFHSQQPDITVEITSTFPKGGMDELAGTYDCFTWFQDSGLPADRLYDLTPFLFADKMDASNDFDPEALEEFSQDGKLFGLPTAYQPQLLYYNADLLAQRGLKPPAADWTYTDFIEMITGASGGGATDSGGDKPTYGLALEYPSHDLDLFLAGRNTRLVDMSGGVPAFLFDTPETQASVQWLAEQVRSDVIFPVTPNKIGEYEPNIMTARQMILDGRVAFWMSLYDKKGGSNYALQDAKFSIGVAPIPLPQGRITWRPNHIAIGQYISRKSQNPQIARACWEWMKFLSEQPESSFGVPARRSVRGSEGWVAQVGQEAARAYQAAVDQARLQGNAPAQGNVYSLGPARDWWNEALAEVVSGADPLPLLAEAQRKADAYSACLGASGDYQVGSDQQKAQAQTTCAERVTSK